MLQVSRIERLLGYLPTPPLCKSKWTVGLRENVFQHSPTHKTFSAKPGQNHAFHSATIGFATSEVDWMMYVVKDTLLRQCAWYRL